MSDQSQGCAAERGRRETRAVKAWKEVKWRLYLLSLRLFYRRFSLIIHYFGMHRMRRICALGGEPFYRCEWCGMHGKKVEIDPAQGLSIPRPHSQPQEKASE